MRYRHDLSTCVFGNAAGTVKTLEEARPLLKSAATRITIGSITIQPRAGNIGRTYHYDDRTRTAWNALGIPNRGMEATAEWLPGFGEECKSAGKELCVSIAGFSPAEYATLAHRFAPMADIIEVNAGCGNLWDGGKQKAIPSYHPQLLREVVGAARRAVPTSSARIGVKISPLASSSGEYDILDTIADDIIKDDAINEIVATNTAINQRGTEADGKEVLSFKETEGAEFKHTGGLSGLSLQPASMKVVGILSERLPVHVQVIGAGGVFTGEHAIRFLDQGASGVVSATAFLELGRGKFLNGLVAEASVFLEEAV